MKHVCVSACIALTLAACSPTPIELGNLEVIPLPREVEQDFLAEPFVLGRGTCVAYPEGDDTLRRTADFLTTRVGEITGLNIRAVAGEGSRGDIVLALDPTVRPDAYRITVSADGARLSGGSREAVFRAAQTLYKALPLTHDGETAPALPVGTVDDSPRFAYRGFMVDVARHYFPLDYLKQLIDLCALHGINYFHWHLTDDQGWRLEIKKYPRLTEVGSVRPRTLVDRYTQAYDETPHGGFYTQDEARELVRYAAERFITVVPEIDLPGHMMSALASYPELGCTGGPYEIPCRWGVFSDVLCGGSAHALEFAKDVLTEVMDIFPSSYVHIGGDECPKERWAACPACQAKIRELGLRDEPGRSRENQLQTYFMGEVAKVIEARGRRMVGWDEMLEGGLTPGATVMSWTSPRGGAEAARLGHDAVMSPIQYLYFSNPHYNKLKGTRSLERVYGFEPMPSGLSPEEEAHVIGVQGCVWTEWTRDSLKMEWQILPRMAALAELQWTLPGRKDFDGFLRRLPALLSRYEAQDLAYRRDIWEPTLYAFPAVEEGEAKVVFRTLDGAEVRYTLDGSVPAAESPLYADTLTVAEGTTVRAAAVRTGGLGPVSEDEVRLPAAR